MSAPERPLRPPHLPSFSIVIETDNLKAVGAGELKSMLGDLATQDLSPACANEVFVIQSGDVANDAIEAMRVAYPWVTVIRSAGTPNYFEAKMEGARRATGELIVLCDSDCRYAPTWLRCMLEPFARHPEIDILTGETGLRITGPYSLAMALAWSFAPFSAHTGLRRVSRYNANCAIFRRTVLLRYPIPGPMPVYRGNGVVHHQLLREGHCVIWQEPAGRCFHPMPANGPAEFFWRWLLYGHDQLLTEQWSARAGRYHGWRALGYGAIAFLKILSLISFKPLRRLPAALRNEPRRLLYLPVSAVIIVGAVSCALIGFCIACVAPGSIVDYASTRLAADEAGE